MKELNLISDLQTNDDLRQEVIDQLNKDIGSHISDFVWNDDATDPFAEFIHSLETVLRNWLSNNKSQLMQVLYRVDLFENQLKLLWTYEPEERPCRLARMILDREFQKVLTRRLYKQK